MNGLSYWFQRLSGHARHSACLPAADLLNDLTLWSVDRIADTARRSLGR